MTSFGSKSTRFVRLYFLLIAVLCRELKPTHTDVHGCNLLLWYFNKPYCFRFRPLICRYFYVINLSEHRITVVSCIQISMNSKGMYTHELRFVYSIQ